MFGGIVIVIGMLVPVDVQRDIVLAAICLFPRVLKVPFATCRSRCVVVAQVVGIDVAAGMRAVRRPQDVLLVVGTLGIELQRGQWLVRQALGYLPVAELVDGLVLAVGKHHAFGPFLGGILPTITTL